MTMLLQQILQDLDAELDRLHSLRKIVDELHFTPSLIQELAPELGAAPRSQPEPEAAPQRRPKPRVVRAAPKPAAAVERIPEKRSLPTALTSSVPAGPVLVSAQALERERRAAPKALSAASSEARTASPDAVIRDLTARWLSGSTGRPA